MGHLIRPHALWPTHGHPKSPALLLFVFPFPFLYLLFRHLMDQEMLKALLGDMFKTQEDRLVCLFCLLVAFCVGNFLGNFG